MKLTELPRTMLRSRNKSISSSDLPMDDLCLIHESVNAHNQSQRTRSWFAWANGLFGQAIYELQEGNPHVLKQSFQDTTRSKDDVGNLQCSPQKPQLAKESVLPGIRLHRHVEGSEHPHDGSTMEHMKPGLSSENKYLSMIWHGSGF